MSTETEDLKGRAKEAAGALTDNDDLRREGKADQTAASAKEKVEKAGDWADDKIDRAKDKLTNQ